MNYFEFDDELEIEKQLIEFMGEGYNQWTFRKDLKSENDLWNNLRQKISQNNVSELRDYPLTDNEFEKIKIELLNNTQTPFDAAKWLKGENGIARITIDRDDVSLGEVSLVLYSNLDIGGGISSYEIVHQIATQSSVDGGRNRRFDVTLLINGLPIVQIELKKSNAKDGIYQAFNQIKKYAEEGLFRNNIYSTVQLFVVSNLQTTRYFANALPEFMDKKFLFSWRTKDNKKVDNLYEFCKQSLNIPDAHRLIADYTIVSEDQDNKLLMVLHPYQIHAIEALMESVSKHESGHIWHATGSGKTLTSFVATKLLAKRPGVDRTIMLIDRKDLDNQTTTEFTKFASEFNTGITSGKGKSNSLIVGTGDTRELTNELLSDSNSNVVIVTTRQKLDSALKRAKKIEEEKGSSRFSKLLGQHVVFIVDECHRAVSSENMEHVKSFFPKSTWFGFTGTPIFEVNKKQANGKLARTTLDQYGPVLHTYTIKNALEDGSVLGFQVEHENTVVHNTLYNRIYEFIKLNNPDIADYPDKINKKIDEMSDVQKETYLDSSVYESNDHIELVIEKIFRPDNAYTKFDFRNGKPTKSAILTTSSIEMAKKYYHAIKKMKKEKNWMTNRYKNHPLRKGRTIEDPDFPRIAITYSLDENIDQAKEKQDEMKQILEDYNKYYGTSWNLEGIERYNGDINNRLARKKAEYKEFGKQIDLVIVVDRLLTGFDAPVMQTLFVDRNLEYAGLIQAFSRTNRTFKGKDKGLIVTFRKPATMERNVENATKLYSNEDNATNLVYPTYKDSKKRFENNYKEFNSIIQNNPNIDENSDTNLQIEYVKNYQKTLKALEALVTYDEFNNDIETKKALNEKMQVIENHRGNYENVKGKLKDLKDGKDDSSLSEIEFFSDDNNNTYNIDSAYIDQLLGNYKANSTNVREEIEKALKKLNKSEKVRHVYQEILNQIDNNPNEKQNDIFSIKRNYFTHAKNEVIRDFANEWKLGEKELHTSAIQYVAESNDIPYFTTIMKNANFTEFKKEHADISGLKYRSQIKEDWINILNKEIIPLDNELR
ncbi:type I restriction endonuclease subunit R [Macrococcus capreoli]|uniref:type I restriction endonuclease subunit R n=1 Tax=Macrococcus capreoli TaxID=2982690 RepID=UPI0021D5BBD2|nr:HsdR family type I site-specific deoxyribonuclease [Macrococcus sp. TMW 2.2395]MCU7558657.1 HsdR family type I site-specific deoxyribonuclease [Macrococcus sp. TMW 2.2395]